MKAKFLIPVLLISFIFIFTACTTTKTATETTAAKTVEAQITEAETTADETTASAPEYDIGDTGPAGGLIFYVNPDYETDGWRYLEAAAEDCSDNNNDYLIQWANGEFMVTGAIETSIGTGMPNTQKNVEIQGEGSYAAKLCYDLTQGGFSDWFLPSQEELDLMYENLYLKGLGSFAQDYYWSSSEKDEGIAWNQKYGNGLRYYGPTLKRLRVRAVRAFN